MRAYSVKGFAKIFLFFCVGIRNFLWRWANTRPAPDQMSTATVDREMGFRKCVAEMLEISSPKRPWKNKSKRIRLLVPWDPKGGAKDLTKCTGYAIINYVLPYNIM